MEGCRELEEPGCPKSPCKDVVTPTQMCRSEVVNRLLVYCWYLRRHAFSVRCCSLVIPRLLPLSSTSDLGLREPVVTALLNSCGSTEGLTALRWSGELPVAWDTCSDCPCYLEGFSHHSVVMSFCIKAYVCHTPWWGPLTEKCSIRSESYSVGRYKSSSVF